MTILTVLVVLALIATIISLGWGIGSMAHGGDYDKKHSVQLMGVRVGFQGLTIVLLLIALVVSNF
ncbi:MAG: hypothetical protein BMS9Abin36_1948 [Gammaproteobacteria bacterium]|nr:MAG: hypothetical protein BMS9Abin36_1948 [Gammaproteobacteria bacterium]